MDDIGVRGSLFAFARGLRGIFASIVEHGASSMDGNVGYSGISRFEGRSANMLRLIGSAI